ncbi:winged helix-turn-helix transcriptional regulator [Limosilactobacillus portuensis]|uniref:winged helix-turn-helix transcriptional regulator n=1 Tax=Limosilactobacillus portuensis TaxID=2742601 RepID=UPI003D734507
MTRHFFMSSNYIIHIVSGKWKPSIICSLGLEEKRFGELKRYFYDLYQIHISEKVLSEQLSQLIHDRMVKRTSYPTVPPKVVYSLTDNGQKMKKLLIEMAEFSEELINSGQVTDVDFKYGAANMKGEQLSNKDEEN